jgi:N-acetylglucosamine-6-phosphate deacetylase
MTTLPKTMIPITTLEGKVWTQRGWCAGRLHFDTRIQALEPHEGIPEDISEGIPEGIPEDVPERFIVPGFIDVHVHGGGGFDVMDGLEGIRQMARFHAQHGTTALLATTITNPWDRVLAVLQQIKQVQHHPADAEAQILGAHLEGPFINPLKLGAQPPFTLLPSAPLLERVLALDIVRVLTLAPELPQAREMAVHLALAGVRVSLGHTLATAEQAGQVIGAVLEAGGQVAGTHLFNAMSGFAGREPGVVGAILARGECYAEVIMDGFHLHPDSFLAVCLAKPKRTLLITDAMRAAGMPNGNYDLGGQSVQVQHGQARLLEGSLAGSLAGSVLTLDQAIRQAVGAGVPLHQAVGMASLYPAQYLGLLDRGELLPNMWADVVVLNAALELEAVYLRGVPLEGHMF